MNNPQAYQFGLNIRVVCLNALLMAASPYIYWTNNAATKPIEWFEMVGESEI